MVLFQAAGRYGNFMFECFTSMAYAWRHDLDFTVPKHSTHHFHNPVYLPHLVNPNFDPSINIIAVVERQHHYYNLPFEESWRSRNIMLQGYFQSEKYFIDYRDRILNAVNYPWNMKKGLVSVHVRRGDYLVLTEKHPPVTKEWYELAMSKFPGYQFCFYSDDIGWCKNEFGQRDDCLFSYEGIEQDAISISQCEHHINSSSTFSLIAAWLNRNPDKIVYTPKEWFTPNWGGLITDDIVPESFIKL